MRPRRPLVAGILFTLAVVGLAGCAAGDPRFSTDAPAGFWVGLWHGIISFVTLVIHIFADQVHVYEVHNTGGWYDFGFLLGVTAIWGGGSTSVHQRSARKRADKEWEEIGQKVERKLKRKIRQWAEAEPDDEWDVVEEKAERKLKARVREWAETE
jgi:hypothetical protein